MASSSPHSPTFERRGQHTSRATLLWFGGHPGHGSARTQLFRRFRHDGLAEPGFVLADSLRGRPEDRQDAVNMSLGSVLRGACAVGAARPVDHATRGHRCRCFAGHRAGEVAQEPGDGRPDPATRTPP